MFQDIPTAPPDPIFGLTEAFREDSNRHKINLGVGVYKDENDQTPVLEAVKRAERRILEAESSKAYLPIEGTGVFTRRVQELLFGMDHEILTTKRAATAHTPGGTGALRMAGDLLQLHRPQTKVWLPDPSWPNHRQIFGAAGLSIETIPYADAKTHDLAFEQLCENLRRVQPGDTVVLQGGCHNPTGIDPSDEQWDSIGGLLAERQALPVVDIAYQGFGRDFDSDAAGVRKLSTRVPELVVCSSFSKNFALYNERVGALTVVTDSKAAAAKVLSQIKLCVRSSYSNPPAHGAAIVVSILDDAELRAVWQDELATMRQRIYDMRRLFVDSLDQREVRLSQGGNQFFLRQWGMFSISGLDKQQVRELREKHSVYIVGSGRVNFAGMTPSNMDYLCDAIAALG
jgi:aspartate/tyrosine/aromatic aminotransferase